MWPYHSQVANVMHDVHLSISCRAPSAHFAQAVMPKKNKYRCWCPCGCGRKPGCRRVVCHSCHHHICPGYCLALEWETANDRQKYALCRRCVNYGTVLPDDGVDRIICDGKPYPPLATMQELIVAYVIFSYLQAYSLALSSGLLDDSERDADGWDIL